MGEGGRGGAIKEMTTTHMLHPILSIRTPWPPQPRKSSYYMENTWAAVRRISLEPFVFLKRKKKKKKKKRKRRRVNHQGNFSFSSMEGVGVFGHVRIHTISNEYSFFPSFSKEKRRKKKIHAFRLSPMAFIFVNIPQKWV